MALAPLQQAHLQRSIKLLKLLQVLSQQPLPWKLCASSAADRRTRGPLPPAGTPTQRVRGCVSPALICFASIRCQRRIQHALLTAASPTPPSFAGAIVVGLFKQVGIGVSGFCGRHTSAVRIPRIHAGHHRGYRSISHPRAAPQAAFLGGLQPALLCAAASSHWQPEPALQCHWCRSCCRGCRCGGLGR